jgi:hypothetical protein
LKFIDVVRIPAWLQWPYSEKHLPHEPHDKDWFKHTLKQITRAGGSKVTRGVVLAFGLLLWEIHYIHFFDLEESYISGTPAQFSNSLVELNWQDIVFEQMPIIL